MTPQDQAIQSIADEYDFDPRIVASIFDPGALSEGNKFSAAGGSDPKTARNPIFLRNPGDRLPTSFELQNQWAYNADREPIIGDGGKTLNVNSANIDDAIEFTYAGYVPPKGSPAYKSLENFYSSTGETLDETLQRLEVTGNLGQALEQYPTGLSPVTNKDAIPVASSITYNAPAYDTIQLGDGFTQSVTRSTGWDGKPAGYNVDPYAATSANNFPALNGNMTTDDPNFKPTKNPPVWILPNGNSTKSIPGSGNTVGFNTETWKFQTRPWEVGSKTTWEMAATDSSTGKIDPTSVTKEVAILLKQYGNLPAEYNYLTTDAPSYYAPVPKTAPINLGVKTTPINVPGNTTPATGMPKVQDVSKTLQTGGGFSGTGAMYANRPEPVGSVAPPATAPVASKTPLDIGERGTAPMAAPAVASVNVQTGGTNDGTGAMYAQRPSTTPGTVADTKYQANVAELNSRVVSFNAPIPRPSATVRSLA
jgi:hypothetical protein